MIFPPLKIELRLSLTEPFISVDQFWIVLPPFLLCVVRFLPEHDVFADGETTIVAIRLSFLPLLSFFLFFSVLFFFCF